MSMINVWRFFLIILIGICNGNNIFNRDYEFTNWKHFSGISPYFESNKEQLNPELNPSCQIEKSIYLIRHGRIYVDDYDYFNIIKPFLKRLNQLKQIENLKTNSHFNFLLKWNCSFTNKTVEQMTQLGLYESFQFGLQIYSKSKYLLNQTNKFQIWASSSKRTKQTAEYILQGLLNKTNIKTKEILLISEDKHRGINSLTPTKTCHSFKSSQGSKQANTWLTFYSKSILKRLNSQLKRFQLNSKDIFAMQQICAYEFNLKQRSDFCSLFTIEDILSFEYYFDIKYHYEIGYGNQLSPYLGIHWLKSISNLFIKSKQNLYLTIVHREMLPIVLVSLGLLNQSNLFPLNQINFHRTFQSSLIISFLSRIQIELFSCSNQLFIRILSNNKVLPLSSCSHGPQFSCPYQQFIHFINQRFQQYKQFHRVCQLNQNESNLEMNFYENSIE